MVTERITLVSRASGTAFTARFRSNIPARADDYELFLNVKSVTDGNGSKLKYESSTSNGSRDLKIYIPDAVDTTRIVELVYLVRNGTRFFKDYDEFYWNVTGNDWPVPIDHAAGTVKFPGCRIRIIAGPGFHRRLWLFAA